MTRPNTTHRAIREAEAAQQVAPADKAITDAYNRAAPSGGSVPLATIREAIGGTRAEQDEALIRLHREQKLVLVEDADQRHLTPADRDNAIRLGGSNRHRVRIERADDFDY